MTAVPFRDRLSWGSVKKVVYCTDLSANASSSTAVAMQQAVNLGAALIVVHVEPSHTQGFVPLLDEARRGGRRAERLEALRRAVPIASSIPHEHVLLQGDPAQEIVALAARENAELIVLPTRARTMLDRLLRGSVVTEVVRLATCPVYAFRPEPEHAIAAPLPRLGLVGAGDSGHARDAFERELTVLLSGEVAALRMWFHHQLDAVRIVAEEPMVVASVQQLVSVATLDHVAQSARERLRGFMHVVDRGCPFADFLVLTPNGRIVASRLDALLGRRLPPEQYPFLARAVRGEALVSAPTVLDLPPPGPRAVGATVRPSILAAAPVEDGGRVLAVVALWLRVDDFNRIVASSGPYPSLESYVFDRRGTMLSPSRFEAELLAGDLPLDWDSHGLLHLLDPGGNLLDGHRPSGTLPLTRMAQAAVRGNGGIDLDGYRDYRGVEVVGAWRWLADLELGVAVEVDRDAAFPRGGSEAPVTPR